MAEYASVKEDTNEANGTFKVIISTEDVDRHGEIVDQDGLSLDRYITNPVVLWAHNHDHLPIATATKVYKSIENGKKCTIAEGYFAGHEVAQEIRALYDQKILRTTSIGFIPKRWEGNKIVESELIEFSFVSVPANPFAISLLSSAVVEQLVAKGILGKSEDENAQEGADIENGDNDLPEGTQEQPEGTEGEATTEDPNKDEGTGLVQQPEEKKGRMISKANEESMRAAVEALKTATSALEAILDNLPKEESVSTEGTEVVDTAAKDFLEARKFVQDLATQVSTHLAILGAKSRKYY